ncbi:MAG TPA: sugar nucleotide-binding protein [Verrucomicrobiae bacterium]|nr:sugar nucleotide-binding protein [Verrucomicrobiae bacterium]
MNNEKPRPADTLDSHNAGVELWGGIECSANRVGDKYFNQLERSGHISRIEDLGLLARLGVRTLRYPILWEHSASGTFDWSWIDERMLRLRELNIAPIVGLVHHGSGPAHTSLLDSNFPDGLARHARAVAERYPWVRYFNPVNEPLATARFSCLSGHWHPHYRDTAAFSRALVNQCRAVQLAVAEIRNIIPEAQLVQTENIGKTYSTEPVGYQADFENERRWLTFDLLSGRCDSSHPMWDYLSGCRVSIDALEALLAAPCRPDILGINYHLTGERFLDEKLQNYPERSHAGNGKHAYADVSAVRVCAPGIGGVYQVVKEAWERYRSAIAITEVHLGSTRDEQLRWFMDVWHAGQLLRREGVDLRAITMWALLGAYDWDSLLTRSENSYDPGAFDLRGATPRMTALGKCARALARREPYSHPVLDGAGWWQRPQRLLYPPQQPRAEALAMISPPQLFCRPRREPQQPLLITGAAGTLGQAFRRLCDIRGLAFRAVTRHEMDIADPISVRRMIREAEPWAVINAAGYSRVDQAEAEPDRCFRENTHGAICLANSCRNAGIPLVTFSADSVFDGAAADYVESDATNPLNIYGLSKAQAESAVTRIHAGSLVIRTCCLFGPWDQDNIVTAMVRELRANRPFWALVDATLTPAYLPDLVNATLDLLIDGERGIWHLANDGATTWHNFLLHAAELGGVSAAGLEPLRLDDADFLAARPRSSVLRSNRGSLLPPWEKALERYFSDRRAFLRELTSAENEPRQCNHASHLHSFVMAGA